MNGAVDWVRDAVRRKAGESGLTPHALARRCQEVSPGTLSRSLLYRYLDGSGPAIRSDALSVLLRVLDLPLTPPAGESAAENPASESDPFLALDGFFTSDVPDAAERHDDYLGQSLNDELQASR